ncbi:MAG: FtsQ-type POTRA domain-containing protein [Myxococcales bacterium]|nr:FtsQ-type POTRA domain-containing protein [Myxococcales bacterium]
MNDRSAWVRELAPRIVTVLVALMLPVVAWIVVGDAGRSRIFLVDDVTVEGTQTVDPAELLALAGLDRPTSVLSLSASRLAERIERHNWVARADVHVDFRARAVRIEVTERALAGIAVDDGAWLIDTDGKVIRARLPEDPTNVPFFIGLHLEAGHLDADGAARARRLIDLAHDVAESGLGLDHGDVVEAHDRGASGVAAVFADGFEIRVRVDELERRLDSATRAAAVVAGRPSYALADGPDPDRVTFGYHTTPATVLP